MPFLATSSMYGVSTTLARLDSSEVGTIPGILPRWVAIHPEIASK